MISLYNFSGNVFFWHSHLIFHCLFKKISFKCFCGFGFRSKVFTIIEFQTIVFLLSRKERHRERERERERERDRERDNYAKLGHLLWGISIVASILRNQQCN